MRGRGRLLIVLGVILGLAAAGGVLYIIMTQPPTPTARSACNSLNTVGRVSGRPESALGLGNAHNQPLTVR